MHAARGASLGGPRGAPASSSTSDPTNLNFRFHWHRAWSPRFAGWTTEPRQIGGGGGGPRPHPRFGALFGHPGPGRIFAGHPRRNAAAAPSTVTPPPRALTKQPPLSSYSPGRGSGVPCPALAPELCPDGRREREPAWGPEYASHSKEHPGLQADSGQTGG